MLKTILTLTDGIERDFVLDLRALKRAASASGVKLHELLTGALTEHVGALVFAGTYVDAVRRGEEWTVEKVETLIDLKAMSRALAAIKLLAGETMPEGKTGPAAENA
jgi:hypothetical protein